MIKAKCYYTQFNLKTKQKGTEIKLKTNNL